MLSKDQMNTSGEYLRFVFDERFNNFEFLDNDVLGNRSASL